MWWKSLCLALSFASFGAAQTDQAESDLQFEVASVKVALPAVPRGGSQGGPGTSDPGHIRYGRTTLKSLLAMAYGFDMDLIQGAQWLGIDQFVIDAKVPAGATKDQVKVMLQHLLRDRFHVAIHKEITNFPGYELVISKGGPKIKPAPPASVEASAATTEGKRITTTKDAEGFPILMPGLHYQAAHSNGVSRASYRDITMAGFARALQYDIGPALGAGPFAQTQIADKTGLTGGFDFTLQFRAKFDDMNSDSPDVFSAIEKQLGLRLQKEVIPVEVLVVDRADRTPTEN